MSNVSNKGNKASGFLHLASIDYLAARALLIDGQLQAAMPLAATAIEKELKAILLAIGEHVGKSEHLCHRLIQALRNKSPGIISTDDEPFLKFMMRAYDLRYAQTDRESYSIVLNQYRTLICLDSLMLRLDKPFNLSQGVKIFSTPISQLIENKDPRLLIDNIAIDPVLASSILIRNNKVLELGIGKKYLNLRISYETEGVSMLGDFLKAPNFLAGSTEFQLTFG